MFTSYLYTLKGITFYVISLSYISLLHLSTNLYRVSSDTSETMTETVIGNYRIISELGQGACGRVYLAQHTVLEKRVAALKLMHNVPLHEHQEKTLFLQESHMLEVLRHPYILPIVDAGINEGLPYIVTEYAPNGSLRQLLNQHINQPLSQEKALSILAQIGSALHYAHEQQVVHRDLKPENILFNAQGNALIADFGLAITLASMSMHVSTQAGTPAYMAPEQVQGVVSREGDQYALGCIAYELFTGHHLFTAPNIAVMMFNHLYTVPVPPSEHNPDIAPHIEEAILKALAKDRHDRHANIAAFLTALEAPSVTAEVLTYTRPISLIDEDKQTLSQNSTLLPTIALDFDVVTPLLATQLASNSPIEATDPRGAEKHNAQQAQYVSLSNDPFRLKQRRILVASVSLLILAAVMIPFLFQLQPAGTKGTLAIAPPVLKTTPYTQPRRHSASKNSAVQTPQATALVLSQPSVTTISTDTGIATPTETPIDTPTHTSPVVTPTEIPIVTATGVPVAVPTATPVVTPTDTPVPTPTDTPIVTLTNTPVPTPTDTPIVTPTNTPLVIPTGTPVPTPTDTPTTG